MFENYEFDPFVLSSVCPYSCALAAYALRLGGVIDPDFLLQCQIMDPEFKKTIDALKPIPLDFGQTPTDIGYQEDIYLDMSAPNSTRFYDLSQFKQHNTWLGTPEQWDSMYADHDDIVIDLI